MVLSLPVSVKFWHIEKFGYKSEREEQNHGIDWQHNDVFEYTRGQNRQEGISVQDSDP